MTDRQPDGIQEVEGSTPFGSTLCFAACNTFEVPDVIGFEDHLGSSRALAKDFARDRCPYRPAPIDSFPYPNPPDAKPRTLTIADSRDLIMLRVAAGRIAGVTDRLLRYYGPDRQARLHGADAAEELIRPRAARSIR